MLPGFVVDLPRARSGHRLATTGLTANRQRGRRSYVSKRRGPRERNPIWLPSKLGSPAARIPDEVVLQESRPRGPNEDEIWAIPKAQRNHSRHGCVLGNVAMCKGLGRPSRNGVVRQL